MLFLWRVVYRKFLKDSGLNNLRNLTLNFCFRLDDQGA